MLQQPNDFQQNRTGLSRLTHRLSNWFASQLNFRLLVQTGLVCALFGLFPGSWLLGFPILAGYFIVRSRLRITFPNWFRHNMGPYATQIRQFWNNINQLTAEYVANYVVNHPLHVTKLVFSFFILFAWSMPFSFFSIYGLFRINDEDWGRLFSQRLNNMYDTTLGLAVGASRNFPYHQRLTAFFAVCVCAGLSFIWLGAIDVVLDFSILLLEMCATSVGLTVIGRDVADFFHRPIHMVTQHPGKMYGLIWGRWLSFALFPGRIVGSMGPASGHVDSAGLFPSVFGVLFPPSQSQGWFTFGSTLRTFMVNRIVAFINSIVTSVFFSYNMRLQGDFYGVLGPTSFQIFACMAIGCFVGYCFEGLAHRLYDLGRSDLYDTAELVTPSIERRVNSVYRYRWHIGYLAAVIPLLLSVPSGAIFYQLAFNNTYLAALWAGLTSVTVLATLKGAGTLCYRGYEFARSKFARAVPVEEAAQVQITTLSAADPVPNDLLPTTSSHYLPAFTNSEAIGMPSQSLPSGELRPNGNEAVSIASLSN